MKFFVMILNCHKNQFTLKFFDMSPNYSNILSMHLKNEAFLFGIEVKVVLLRNY